MRRHLFLFALPILILMPCLATAAAAEEGKDGKEAKPDFNRDIRPILSQNCFKCHGMDEKARKSGMRLDVREAALKPAKSGARPIVPGKPDESALIQRIFSADPDEVMPPGSKLKLTGEQKQKLRAWIAGGAEYAPHWAFVPPKQPEPPLGKGGINPIDAFVRARLEREGLKPAPEADRHALCRRVHLDLIGLPPTPEEADAFSADKSPDAYEKLVEKLLASPRYGERWARRWLDLARYADTNGYEKDRARVIWPYRDWVVRALNDDLPFDRFTIEQLGGDMLPNAAPESIVATGFHRNTMLNEEGGIDPLEFRYHAVVDRVNTTSTAWLGLTVGCCQCHTHKYDPIHHREYFQLFALLNDADEPEYEIPDAERERQRAGIEEKIARLTAELPAKWAVATDADWKTVTGAASAVSGVRAEVQPDGSIRFGGAVPEKDSYTITFDTEAGTSADRLRLQVLKDGGGGPGRTPHGNFVLSEISVSVAPKDAPEKAQPVKLSRATADFSQKEFDVSAAIDGQTGGDAGPATKGWAIDSGDAKKPIQDRTAVFYFAPGGLPAAIAAKALRWTVKLEQNYGGKHVIGRLRLSLGAPVPNSNTASAEARRKEAIAGRFAEWERAESAQAVDWRILRPAEMKTSMPLLAQLDDGSILASGDVTKSDTYDLKFDTKVPGVAAVRMEVLPHESLPARGPGMAYYEGPKGDFFLSEFHIRHGGQRLKVARATLAQSKGGKSGAQATQDGDMSSGWSADGLQGAPNAAVFVLEKPVDLDGSFELKLQFERHYACPLGRFRVSVASVAGTLSPDAQRTLQARGHPAEVEALLAKPAGQRTPQEKERLYQRFLETAPELAAARDEIQKLRTSIPRARTTLVMRERPAGAGRTTHLYHRGEFTQPKERVEPGLPGFLTTAGYPSGADSGDSSVKAAPSPGAEAPPSPHGGEGKGGRPSHPAVKNRLDFARWLVAKENPLTARVTVNRQWQAFFGRGLVRTLEDFGYQGELPSHPELLDWLAVEFMKQGWSLKNLHKLIVTSATYRQASQVTPELAQRDPGNVLLARGPRFRLEAEIVRDSVLKAAGLLSEKMGGPGVFPPQPANVTTEGAYGALAWNVSQGEDRYRRSLYTFIKRTAPFAMYGTFDGPAGEACTARREISNSALQALTLLNDPMFLEAAQALGRQFAAGAGSDEEKAARLFRQCLTRAPQADELAALAKFAKEQRERFNGKDLDAEKFAGKAEGDSAERAAWTAAARAVLNLDEMVTKK